MSFLDDKIIEFESSFKKETLTPSFLDKVKAACDHHFWLEIALGMAWFVGFWTFVAAVFGHGDLWLDVMIATGYMAIIFVLAAIIMPKNEALGMMTIPFGCLILPILYAILSYS